MTWYIDKLRIPTRTIPHRIQVLVSMLVLLGGIVVLVGNYSWALFLSGGELPQWEVVLEPINSFIHYFVTV